MKVIIISYRATREPFFFSLKVISYISSVFLLKRTGAGLDLKCLLLFTLSDRNIPSPPGEILSFPLIIQKRPSFITQHCYAPSERSGLHFPCFTIQWKKVPEI